MVALSDFCRDRRDEHVKLSNETAMKQSQKGFTRIEDAACAMIEGVKNIQELKKKAKNDFSAFTELFPISSLAILGGGALSPYIARIVSSFPPYAFQ